MSRSRVVNRLTSWANRPSEADRAAGFELAVASRRFSRRTREVLDDKLSFSAALMRAGEVEAANRLLAEVEEEVLTEEAALIERVNEVKIARSIERDKVTRGTLARTLAVAMLGSSLLAFSVAGAAVVGLFKDDQAIHGSDPDAAGTIDLAQADRVLGTREVRVLNNVSLPMTDAQFRRFTKLTSGDFNGMDEHQLELFLLEFLPPALAEKIHFALVTGLETLPEPVAENVIVASQRFEETREEQSPPPSEEDGPPAGTEPTGTPADPQPTPEPSDTEEPKDDETPAPDESPEDESNLPLLDDDEEEGS